MPFPPRVGIPYGVQDLKQLRPKLPTSVSLFHADDCRSESIVPDFILISSRTLSSTEDIAKAAQYCKDWNAPGILLSESLLACRMSELPFLYGSLPREDICGVASLIEWVLQDWNKEQGLNSSMEEGKSQLAWATPANA